MNIPTAEQALEQTVEWLEKAVIGLNFCPFAKAVHVKRQIRYRFSDAETVEHLATHLIEELYYLNKSDAAEVDTTLLVHPFVLNDFMDYNDFLGVADEIIQQCGMQGLIQVASFHPQYCFSGSSANEISNFTNRSPFPILHLLRESSVSRAVDGYPDTDNISRQNIEKLNAMGLKGWNALWSKSDSILHQKD